MAMMEQAPRQVAVKVSPEGDRLITSGAHYLHMTKKDLVEAAVAFYGGLFGWDLEDAMPPGSDGKYYIARLRGGDVAAIGSQPPGGPQIAAWNTYVWVESADEAAAIRSTGFAPVGQVPMHGPCTPTSSGGDFSLSGTAHLHAGIQLSLSRPRERHNHRDRLTHINR